ncbi:MAG: RluA family pseudouridine synthase [Bacteroidaceae bacterium]|nr:RluA family pseudouridine synthase [Bacteroidaceae bacterium]
MRNRNTEENKRYVARRVEQYTNFPAVKEPVELMEFLMKKGTMSRNKVKSLLARRVILVDKKITTQYNFMLRPGMLVQMSKNHHSTDFKSQLLKLVYEDAYLIVVDKREGLLSVGTDRQKERTAHRILNEYVERTAKGKRVYIVHRLDRDTSGLMVFAKDEKTKHTLQDNWEKIVTERKYVAVVSGEMEKDYGTVTSWLKDNKMYVTYSSLTNNGGDKAITHYQTIKRANGYSLMELELSTGRKNQIRVHMQDLNHPVVGDDKYGNGDNPLGRLGLHAFKLCFYHPVTRELLRFETPYPQEFRRLLWANKKEE